MMLQMAGSRHGVERRRSTRKCQARNTGARGSESGASVSSSCGVVHACVSVHVAVRCEGRHITGLHNAPPMHSICNRVGSKFRYSADGVIKPSQPTYRTYAPAVIALRICDRLVSWLSRVCDAYRDA